MREKKLSSFSCTCLRRVESTIFWGSKFPLVWAMAWTKPHLFRGPIKCWKFVITFFLTTTKIFSLDFIAYNRKCCELSIWNCYWRSGGNFIEIPWKMFVLWKVWVWNNMLSASSFDGTNIRYEIPGTSLAYCCKKLYKSFLIILLLPRPPTSPPKTPLFGTNGPNMGGGWVGWSQHFYK